MLEKYLEKNIYRKIVLLEALYKYEKIDITHYIEIFEAFPTTVQNDLEDLVQTLDIYILSYEKQKKYFYVEFNKDIPLFEIRKIIYQQSLFLKTCTKFLEQQFNYLDLVEEEFISVSKAYNLKKKAEAFFSACHLDFENERLNSSEFETRFLYLYYLTKIDINYETNQTIEFEEACEDMLDLIEHEFSTRVYTEESRYFILQGMNIAYSRQDKEKLELEEKVIVDLKKRPIFKLVEQAWKSLNMERFLPEHEIVYVVSLFNSCEYSFSQLENLFEDHEKLRSTFLVGRPDIIRLIQYFEEEFDQILLGDFSFEEGIIRLTRNAWYNHQVLVHGSFYTLHPKNEELFQRIVKVLFKWGQGIKNLLVIDTNLIYRFIDEAGPILMQEKLLFRLKIVTDSDSKFLLYQSKFSEFNVFDIVLENKFYRSIYEVEGYDQSIRNEYIFCEEALIPSVLEDHPHIIPISVDMLLDHSFLLVCMKPYQHFMEVHNTSYINGVK